MKKTLIIQVSNTFIQDFPFVENVTIKIPRFLVFQDLYKPKALRNKAPITFNYQESEDFGEKSLGFQGDFMLSTGCLKVSYKKIACQ